MINPEELPSSKMNSSKFFTKRNVFLTVSVAALLGGMGFLGYYFGRQAARSANELEPTENDVATQEKQKAEHVKKVNAPATAPAPSIPTAAAPGPAVAGAPAPAVPAPAPAVPVTAPASSRPLRLFPYPLRLLPHQWLLWLRCDPPLTTSRSSCDVVEALRLSPRLFRLSPRLLRPSPRLFRLLRPRSDGK